MEAGESVSGFYDQLAGDYHLIFADWRAAVDRQGEQLDRLIRARLGPPPLTVLDCTCGIGTQAIGLARRGYHVHATDLSPAAVDRARREATAFGVAVTWGVADVRRLDRQVAGAFDVVLSCDNSLPHLLTDEDLGLAARAMRSKLRPGGLLVVSIRDYDQLVEERPRATTPGLLDGPDGRRVYFQLWEWNSDGTRYRLHLFILKETAGQWQTTHAATEYRALRRDELSAALRDAGFTDPRWHPPAESGYYQPIVTALAGDAAALP
jgi:glycine/sarcosine N-methyltransferase